MFNVSVYNSRKWDTCGYWQKETFIPKIGFFTPDTSVLVQAYAPVVVDTYTCRKSHKYTGQTKLLFHKCDVDMC